MTLTYDQIAEEVTDVIMSHQKAPQPCGHHRGCFKTARDGTEHCVACEAAAKAVAAEREAVQNAANRTHGQDVAALEGESMVLKCEDCGLPYRDFGLDSTLSNEQWAMIHPEGEEGILCANCMVSRASHIDGAVVMCMRIDMREDVTTASRARGEEQQC